ncbi:MAG TPA: 30S ribosomal protein S6 [Candidatus Nanoarchaeia archaeon]|nr:30S ribosomal protein S6 [Candidatus Nanoarchaeia archaeon]
MRQYELVVLLHPDLEIDADTPINKIEKLVEQAGGKIIKRDNWGKKRLAYRMNKLDFAVYVYFEIQVLPAGVAALENSLRLSEEIVRHLLVSHEVVRVRPEKKAKLEKQPVAVAEEK